MMQSRVAFIVIGDEILSGRTQDVNVKVLADRLNVIGAALAEVRMIPDDKAVIISTINALRSSYDYVFTSGGIGPTHDDITADCVAEAFGVSLDIRDDAKKILATNYDGGEADLTPARLRMARIPDGAELIANPVSRAPGFKIENVMTLAGVPRIFEAMLEDALRHVKHGAQMHARSMTIHLPESVIAEPLEQIATEFPELSIGSYPQENEAGYFAEIVVKGFDDERVMACIARIKKAFSA